MDAFVTCIYNGLANTAYGGRNMRGARYRASLMSIAETGAEIFCYTSSSDLASLVQFFAGHRNVHFIVKELYDLDIHQKIAAIKTNNPEKYADIFWVFRCPEIMYGKFFFLDEVIKTNPQLKNIYWIDAGLVHPDTTSNKYCVRVETDGYRAPAIYNDKFLERLQTFTKDKLLLMMQDNPHNKPINSKYNEKAYTNNLGAIGGLFGGDIEKMKVVCNSFFDKLRRILDDGFICSEESIINGVYADHPNFFKVFEFQSWYHEGWAERYDPSKVTFSSFFDILIGDVQEPFVDEVVFCTLAIGERFNQIVHRLIATFHTLVMDDMKLLVFTDKPQELPTGNNVTPVPFDSETVTSNFNYSIKYRVIRETYKRFRSAKHIIYLDADCFFVDTIKKVDFDDTESGLNVSTSPSSHLINPSIIEKMQAIAKHRAELDATRVFREATLVFDIRERRKFERFLEEWEKIYHQLNTGRLTHSGECIDMCVASSRSDYPIVHIGNRLFDFRQKVFTVVLGNEGLAYR